MKEIWRDIEGYKGVYQVSNMGMVRRLKGIYCNNTRFLKPSFDRQGYNHLDLSVKGVSVCSKVHRLVALAFLPNPENKRCVNHKNAIKSDNRAENLEWCTHQENSAHAVSIGLMDSTHPRGSNHHLAKLTEKDALEIRENKDSLTRIELGKKYGINLNQITNIKFKRAWKHV